MCNKINKCAIADINKFEEYVCKIKYPSVRFGCRLVTASAGTAGNRMGLAVVVRSCYNRNIGIFSISDSSCNKQSFVGYFLSHVWVLLGGNFSALAFGRFSASYLGA